MEKFLKVKNWDTYQQYKDREPKWIKLHRSLLRDYKFGQLPDKTKAHLMLIWLLAGETDNKIPYNEKWIRAQIQSDEKIELEQLVTLGFLESVQDCTETYKNVPREETEEIREEKSREELFIHREAFDTFWNLYPDGNPKGNKQLAFKKYQSALKETTHEEIIRGLSRYGEYCAAGNFNQHASTWLNQRGWDEAWETGKNKPSRRPHQEQGPSYLSTLGNAAKLALDSLEGDSGDTLNDWGDASGVPEGPTAEHAGSGEALSGGLQRLVQAEFRNGGSPNPAGTGTHGNPLKTSPSRNDHGPSHALGGPQTPEGGSNAKGLPAERLHKADSGW